MGEIVASLLPSFLSSIRETSEMPVEGNASAFHKHETHLGVRYMKLFRNLSLALGTLTAAGALLAVAQPAAAQAPPGFLQLPGTNTSLLITGQVGTRLIFDTIQTGYPGYVNEEADALVPIFIGNGPYSGANSGNMHLSTTDANIGFITSTQTAWGPLQTVLIMATSADGGLSQNPPSVPNFNNVVTPLLGFATIGPLMIGLNTSLFGDDDANPTSDTMNEPLAVSGAVGEIVPSIRYTWKGPGGFSVAAALENATSEGLSSSPVGNWDNVLWPTHFFYPGPGGTYGGGVWGPDQVWDEGSLNGNSYIPDFVVKARLDQPWGHIAIGGLIDQQTTSCSLNCSLGGLAVPTTGFTTAIAAPPGLGTTLPYVHKTGWGVNLTGHLNTWGKDKLMGGVFVGQGLGTYLGEYGAQAGMEIGANATDTGWLSTLPTEYGGFLGYKHFWTEQLRSTLAGGATHIASETNVFNNGTPGDSGYNALASSVINGSVYQNNHWSVVANLIWSPVNNVDLGVQAIYYHVSTVTGAQSGHDLRIETGGAIRF
jgi:hypothetical protein